MWNTSPTACEGRPHLEALEPWLLLDGSLYGHVTDYAGGAALEDITVNVFQGPDPNSAGDDAWDYVTSATTNASGFFFLDALPARQYHLYVPDGQQSGACHYLGDNLYDVVVQDDQTTPDQDFALHQAAFLWGYVKDEAGDPIASAEVLVEAAWSEDTDDWHTARTDATGRYEVFLAPTEEKFYPVKVLTASNPGATYKVYGTNQPGALDDWENLYRAPPQGWTFVGAAAATDTFAGGYLSYLIQTEYAYQVAVDAMEAGAGHYYADGLWTGNVEGWGNLFGAPDGNYALTLDRGNAPISAFIGFQYGSAPPWVTINVVDLGLAAEPTYFGVEIAPDLYAASLAGTRGPDFFLSEGGVIQGRVVNASGEPLPYVWDAVAPWAPIENGLLTNPWGSTQENGQYAIPGVPAGIQVWGETNAWPWEGYERDGVRYAAGSRYLGPYCLEPGDVVEIPDLVVQEAVNLHGVVRDGGGNPIAGAEVHLDGYDVDGGSLDWDDLVATSDAEGRYGFPSPNAPAGQWWVYASMPGFRRYLSEEIVAAPGDDIALDITLVACGAPVTVTGGITNFDEVAPKNGEGVVLPFNLMDNYEDYGRARSLQVFAYDPAQARTPLDDLLPQRWVESFGDVEDGYDDYFVPNGVGGAYEITVQPGVRSVIVGRFGTGRSGVECGLFSDPLTVSGAPGETIPGQDLAIAIGTGVVQGRLFFPSGYAGIVSSSSATVWLRPVGADWFPRAFGEAAPDGTYAMEDLPAGAYYLYAAARDLGEWTSPQFTLGEGETLTQDVLFDWPVWTAGADERWETDANWSGGMAPGVRSVGVFADSAPQDPVLYQDQKALGVDFRTAGLAISGSGFDLIVGSGGIDSAGGGTNTVEPNVAMAAGSTWTVGDQNTLVLNGTLSGGDNTLTKDGEGTLVLNGGQDRSTGLSLTINDGTVKLGGGVLVLNGLDFGTLPGSPGSPAATGATVAPAVASAQTIPDAALYAAAVEEPMATALASGPVSPAAEGAQAGVDLSSGSGADGRSPMAAVDRSTDLVLSPEVALLASEGRAPEGARAETGPAGDLTAALAPLAAPAAATSDARPMTLGRIERETDADLFVWEEGTSTDRPGALSHDLDDDLVDVLELVDLEVPLGV
jgi:hypothetical protein